MTDERYQPIEDYGFLSDCHSTALVSRTGSIDWACLRRFDRGTTFGRLLDADRGGHFAITPVADVERVERRYLPSTLVLETTTTTTAGSVRLTDAFVMVEGGASNPRHQLVRLVEAVDDDIEIDVVIEPRFDYGATRPWLRSHGPDRVSAVGGDDALVISAGCELEIDHDQFRVRARVRVRPGRDLAVVIAAQPAHRLDPDAVDADDAGGALDATVRWWRQWSGRTQVEGPHAQAMERSAIVLKGLTCAPTGAIVAAATTSLPEVAGGTANWDYRYCWVRDSSLALDALGAVGHHEVASGLRDFIVRSSAGHGSEVQVAYGPSGERSLPERQLDLEGWRGSAPVRVGNGAARQVQLDVYGHLLDLAHRHHDQHPLSDDEWRFMASVVDEAVAHRQDPDSGIWELRGPPRHYVHSKVMVWVAIDRGIGLVEDHGHPTNHLERWIEARDDIRHEIETRGVDPDRGGFVQHYGTLDVDAALLRLPLVGFVDADDPRMRSTTDAIQDQLGIGPHGLLIRYPQPDGPTEGAFLLCSCWLVDVLTLQGRLDEAETLLDALMGVSNDLGLFSEECSLEDGRLLGNFPQAFTHYGVITAAQRLHAARSASGPPDDPG